MEFLLRLIGAIVGSTLGWRIGADALERRWKRDAEQGRFFGGLRVRSGLLPGTSRHGERSGAWTITAGRMRLENLDLRDVELVKGPARGSSQSPPGFGISDMHQTVTRVIRVRNAELDWTVPACIAAAALRALRGEAQEPDASEPPTVQNR